jgi:hypothetical protein
MSEFEPGVGEVRVNALDAKVVDVIGSMVAESRNR